MEINSFTLKIRRNPTFVSLFADAGGLDMNLQKNIKSYSVRFCKDRDASFWDKINLTKDADVVYLPVWEEELEAEMPKEKYILKEINIDDFIGSGTSKDNIRLTKAYLYRNIIRYFRSLGCPCKKDFIGLYQ